MILKMEFNFQVNKIFHFKYTEFIGKILPIPIIVKFSDMPRKHRCTDIYIARSLDGDHALGRRH